MAGLVLLLPVCVLLVAPIIADAQAVQLVFLGDDIANNSVVSIDDIGVHVDDSNTRAVLCMTALSECCNTGAVGEWFFPDGSEVMSSSASTDLFTKRTDTGLVTLNKRNAPNTPTGIFHCVIPTQLNPRVNEELFVGVYTENTGVGVPMLESLIYDDSTNTLTCTSRNGPATSVSWTRNCVAVSSDDPTFIQSQIVTDTVNAVYRNRLTIVGDTEAAYSCSVTNSRGTSGSLDTGVGADFEDTSAITVTIMPAANPTAGSSHTLTCTHNGMGSPVQVQWFGPDGNLLQTGGRITVSSQAPYTLTFSQLRESDAGLYVCQVRVGTSGNANSGCTATNVTMQAPTVLVAATGGVATAGQPFTLTCTASGITVPNPDTSDLEYSWRRGTGDPLSRTRNLDLAVQVTTAGNDYICEVTYSPAFLDVSDSVTSSETTTLSVAIPQPDIEVNLNPFLIIYYTGLGLTLQCDVDIPGPQLVSVEADITVNGPLGPITNNSRITVGDVVVDTIGDAYSRAITFSVLSSSRDNGVYSCMGTVRPSMPSSLISNGAQSGMRQLTVVDPVFNVDLPPIQTRVLDVAPYNEFTLMCSFSSQVNNFAVAVPKAVEWTRTIGTGASTVLMSSPPDIEINSSGLNDSNGLSVLTMTANTAGDHAFVCLVSLNLPSVPDVVEVMDQTTVTVNGPADPLDVTNIRAVQVTHNSATIEWTVPSIAYTPETYIVRYGTTSVNSNMSEEETSGSDINATNLMRSVRLTGLEQQTEYMFLVESSSGMGRTTDSATQTFMTTNLPPDPPTMLEFIMTGETSFSFTWEAPVVTNGDLTDYQISCSPQLQGIPPSDTVMVGPAALTGEIAGLFHGVPYNCSVAARNEAGPSDAASVLVTTATVAPTGAPQDFVGTPQSAGRSVMFIWSQPPATTLNGPITNYTIRCTADGTSPVVAVVLPPATVTGFKPDTEYNCNIFVSNSQGDGPRTTPFLNITTLEGTPDAPPQDVMVDHIQGAPDTVTFSWDPPPPADRNGVIAGYIVACTQSGSGATLTLTSNDTSLTFDMLQTGTRYSCTFLAFTSAGNGPETENPLSLLTLPGQPTISEVANVSSTSLRVAWTSPGGIIDAFIIYANGRSTTIPASTDPLVYTIEGLSPFQCVNVSVAAMNQADEGPRSEIVVQKTNQARPGVVNCANSWVSSSASEVVLNWKPPNEPNGVIIGYQLELREFEDTESIIASRELMDNSTNTTFSGLSLVEGVPYTVSITAETIVGQGELPCISINFTNQLMPPPIRGLEISRNEDQTVIIITWGVPPLREARGFVRYEITFTRRSARSTTKRQSSTVCTVDTPVCSVPIEQGRVEVTGADPAQEYTVRVVPVNGDGEAGDSLTLNAGVRTPLPIAIIVGVVVGVVIALLILLLLVIIVVCCVRTRKRKSSGELQTEPDAGFQQRYSPFDGEEPSKPMGSGDQELTSFNSDLGTPPPPSTTCPLYEDDGVDHMVLIPLSVFPEHVARMHQDRDKGFEREYSIIPNTEAAHEVATLNKTKNRFANICPFDFCRVKLAEIPGVEGSDYVNASYIDGYNRKNAYIAAQGPMPNTLADFWRMIWEHRLTSVVMLTKCTEGGKRKCEQYWPESVNDTYTPSGSSISILMTELQAFADYEIRKFLVTDEAQEDAVPLEVFHYYFLSWPDHGVPQYATALIGFIRRVRMSFDKNGPPMLIHCSAGVGRTGTYIALDYMLERIQDTDTINVFELLCMMREKRISMVQTIAQYVFIHDALEELITCGSTAITAPTLRQQINRLHKIVPGTANKGFEEQFDLLNRVSRKFNETDCSNALEKYNMDKNRYSDRVPYNISRARLRPTGLTGAEYINASFVDGYKKRSAYIAAQAPLKETVNDFWRLIWEFKTKVIVQVCSFNEGGEEACFPYWPTCINEPVMYGKVRVTLVNEKPDSSFIVRTFDIKEDKASVAQNQPASFIVTQFHCPEWPEAGRPSNSGIILKLLDEMEKVERSTPTKHITVLCNDGVGRTGTFMCIHSMLDRLKTEGIVDFFQFIKSSRIHRAGLVSELEHYIFCHDVLADYINRFDTYANFKDLTRRSQVNVL